MKSTNEFYYICKKGHLTVGTTDRKQKCDKQIKEVKLVRKGKAGIEQEVVKKTICNEELVEFHEIPKELDYFSIWEPQVIRAFLLEQEPYALREGFLIDIQRVFTALKTKINDLERELKKPRKEKRHEE